MGFFSRGHMHMSVALLPPRFALPKDWNAFFRFTLKSDTNKHIWTFYFSCESNQVEKSSFQCHNVTPLLSLDIFLCPSYTCLWSASTLIFSPFCPSKGEDDKRRKRGERLKWENNINIDALQMSRCR
jgi:hypothetical protein